jgi:DNA repair protein RAD50
MESKTKFDEKIANSQTQISKLDREKSDINTKFPVLKKTIDNSIWEISKLQTEAEVNELIHCQYWHLAAWNVVVIFLWFKLQAHMSLRSERDSCIKNIFDRYNLGSLPKPPFSAEDALNLTNRVKSRLGDLEKDLEDKKVTLLFSLFGYMNIYSLLCAFDWTEIGKWQIFKDDFFLLFNFWGFG